MIKRIESGVAGRMLGFDYLWYIKSLALSLGIKGVVFTKNDGSIRIIAEGEEKDLIKFTNSLEKNSPYRVENFYVKWMRSMLRTEDFYVLTEK